MTIQQAIECLEKATGMLQLTRQDHLILMEAIRVLKAELVKV